MEWCAEQPNGSPGACAADRPETHLSVRDLILGGRLLPFSCKVREISKGDAFRLHLLPDGSIRKRTPAN